MLYCITILYLKSTRNFKTTVVFKIEAACYLPLTNLSPQLNVSHICEKFEGIFLLLTAFHMCQCIYIILCTLLISKLTFDEI